MHTLHVATSWLSSAARLSAGMWRAPELGPRPVERLVVYEFEACPFCRRVREALCHLDLEVEVRPCPKGGQRFRPEAQARSGRSQFPFLVDPNTGDELLESQAIVAHLYQHYGAGSPPRSITLDPAFMVSSQLASLARLGQGMRARPSRAPEQPLELFGFETSPYCRIVRERLCELELPYILRNVPKQGEARPELERRGGQVLVPWLSDPNTGTDLYESADIVRYLQGTYGA